MELRIESPVLLKGFTLNVLGRSLVSGAQRRLVIAAVSVAMLLGLGVAAESQAVQSQRALATVEQVSQHGRAWSIVRPPSDDSLRTYGRAWSVRPPSDQLSSYRSGWSRVPKSRGGSLVLRSSGRAWRQ